jgi:hypothetical protein
MLAVRRFTLLAACLGTCVLLAVSPAAGQYSPVNISNNNTADFYPYVSGSNVTWWGDSSSGGAGNVFYYNGTAATKLTFNGGNAGSFSPRISGSTVVWYNDASSVGNNDTEVYYYDGAAPVPAATAITANGLEDIGPQISGNNVVWEQNNAATPGSSEIWYRNLSFPAPSAQRLTGPDLLYDQIACVSGNGVAWMHDNTTTGNAWEIQYSNVTGVPPPPVPVPTQITSHPGPRVYPTAMDDHFPRISGTSLVWAGEKVGPAQNDWEVFYHDLSTHVTTRITNDDALPGPNRPNDTYVQVDGKRMVWTRGYGGTETEVFLCDMSSGSPVITQITNDLHGDSDPRISGNNIVWVKDANDLGTNYEIYMYNITQARTWRLTNNGNRNDWHADIDGMNVVWSGFDGQDFDIYKLNIRSIISLPGDANQDGTVDGSDLNTVLSNYNQTGMDWFHGDFSDDGTVDGTDLNIVLSNYNQSIPVAAAVPEPGTLGMLALGALGLLALAWRRPK